MRWEHGAANSRATPTNFCAAICLQSGQELAHTFQSAIQFGHCGGIRNPNVFAGAEAFAGDGDASVRHFLATLAAQQSSPPA